MKASVSPATQHEDPRKPMTDDEPAKPLRYAYKASVAGSQHLFELTEQGLSFQAGFRSGVWPYRDIARIRLSYLPVSMLRHRFRADIRNAQGKTVKIVSATWSGIVTMAPQDDAYRAFVGELHRRIAAERDVICVAGLQPIAFALAIVLCGAVLLAIAALFVRALLTGAWPAALFMLGFAAWSGWYIGGFLMRNKPGRYEPQNIPVRLMP
jgi:hypothetical protein